MYEFHVAVRRFNLIHYYTVYCETIRRLLKNQTQRKTQLMFYKIVAVPTLMYECKTWTLLQKDLLKIQTSEIKFLRAVKGFSSVSYTHLDVYKRQLWCISHFAERQWT